MRYKLTLTNELGEVLDWWLPTFNKSEPVLEDGNVHFDLDDDDDGLYLLDEVKRAIGQSEQADKEQEAEEPCQPHGPQPKYSGRLKIIIKKTTYNEIKDEYLALMDEERAISQQWKLRTINRKKARARIQEIWDKRNALMDNISDTTR